MASEYRNKHFDVLKYFQKKRAEALIKMTSAEGILLRMNRSIQSEDAFGEVKSNMDFKRFLCRDHKNILAESILAGIAPNVNKLHSKIQRYCCGEYLHPPIKAA